MSHLNRDYAAIRRTKTTLSAREERRAAERRRATPDAPHPTPTRLKLAEAIAADEIVDHGHTPPLVTYRAGGAVTAAVRELYEAGLAQRRAGWPEAPYPVELTDAGRAWLARGEAS